jgi:hypothetical protein
VRSALSRVFKHGFARNAIDDMRLRLRAAPSVVAGNIIGREFPQAYKGTQEILFVWANEVRAFRCTVTARILM